MSTLDMKEVCGNCGERYGSHYGKACPSATTEFKPLQIALLERDLAAMTAERDALNTGCSEYEAQIDTLRTEREEAQKGVRLLQKNCDAYAGSLNTARVHVAAQKDALDDLRAELSALKANLASADEKIAELQDFIQSSTVTPEARAIVADFLEEQIAFRLEEALVDGQISANYFVTQNRKVLRELIDMAISKAQRRKEGEQPCQPIDPTGSNAAPGVPTSGAATLLPCPFCGAQATINNHNKRVAINCTNPLCWSQQKCPKEDFNLLVSAWNKRTPAPRESTTVPSVAEATLQVMHYLAVERLHALYYRGVESILSQLTAAQSARIAELEAENANLRHEHAIMGSQRDFANKEANESEADKVRLRAALARLQRRTEYSLSSDEVRGDVRVELEDHLVIIDAAMNSQP